MMQPKEEAKPEPAAEEKPAPTPDLPKLFEAVRLGLFCFAFSGIVYYMKQ